ncbi:phage tail protein [Vibrio quintilis]|uniref:p2 phage tail completion protein R (GpR) n=1 Tax=Vibrio quintilis TaxID=1117707 RepID=A0A1M7YZL8_9VIBR|nr:phage tail protein [Vibrio quintilis]SHO57886.1 P2 phage tail completion protein R (GpR) [Vibrio quintilis]
MTTQYQSGYKLRALKTFIDETVGHHIAKHITAEMSDITLRLNSKNMGRGMDLLIMRYTAEFYCDRYPYQKHDPAVLFANVGAWLMDNDRERDDHEPLADPDVDVVIEDEQSAEIILTVEFEEPIRVVEAADGPIYWRGKRWRIEAYEIWVAENIRDVVIR